MCHEDTAKALLKSPHGIVNADGAASLKGENFKGKVCESCHGPGSNHVETLSALDIRNPAKLSPAEVDRTCLTCHRNQPTVSGRLEASHARNSIACTTCHSIHGPGQLVTRKPAELNAKCESCHIDVKASFAEPFGHRVPQNAMTCVDCHNPHGTFKPGLQRMANANEPGCLNCHGDKRGPFVFEHAPVREEGCQSCHMPHGSQNAKMLIRQEVRLVCLECHANLPVPNTSGIVTGVVPPAFHDMTSPRYRNCTVCHQKVHGSHIDRNLLR
jgi:DmsE family decaheme c-type cytochrome